MTIDHFNDNLIKYNKYVGLQFHAQYSINSLYWSQCYLVIYSYCIKSRSTGLETGVVIPSIDGTKRKPKSGITVVDINHSEGNLTQVSSQTVYSQIPSLDARGFSLFPPL